MVATPDEDDIIAEAFEQLAFNYKAKRRLKNNLSIEELVSGGSIGFELESSKEEFALEDEDKDINKGFEAPSYVTSLFKEKKDDPLSKFKNNTTLQILAGSDEFMSGTFSEIKETMTPIDRNGEGLVMKQVIQAGNGTKVTKDTKVFYHYVAVCDGADEPFDSTVLRGAPAIADMRTAELIPGLCLALASMEVNEVSKFIIHSSMAFGKAGIPPRIPPESDVLFIVEVLRIIDEDLLKCPFYMTAEERAGLPFNEIYEAAEQLRMAGNNYHKDGDFASAVKKYRKAVTMLLDYPGGKGHDKKYPNLLIALYSNLAQCYLLLGKPTHAANACSLGMQYEGGKQNAKLLFRCAKANLQLQDCERAKDLCDQALKLEPNNQPLQSLRSQINEEEYKQQLHSKKVYQAMFK